MKKQNKVYCKNCYYYSVGGNCRHLSNLSWLDTSIERISSIIDDVETLNKLNDCTNYQKGDRYSLWNTFLRLIRVKEELY